MRDSDTQRAKTRAATLSITSAILLTIIKLSVGLVTNSLAILSLAVDSFFDIAGSGTTYFSIRISGRPPDPEHRYGHGKIENLGGLLVASLLLLTVGYLLYESINRLFFRTVSMVAEVVGFSGIIVSMAIGLAVSWYLKRTARRYNSQVLEANALQFRMDMWTQTLVIIGLIFASLSYPTADPLVAILVSGYITYHGLIMGRKAVDALLDRVPQDLVTRVEDAVEGCKEVVRYDNLRVRTSGPQTFVDMRIYVPRVVSLEKAHNIASSVEARVKDNVPGADVIIHVEVEEQKDKERVADRIRLISSDISGVKGVHDLWVRRVEGVFEIDAHIQVDSELSINEAHKVASLFEDRLKKEFGEASKVTIHIDTEVDRVIYQKPLENLSSIRKSVEKIVSQIEEVESCGNISVKSFDSELHVSVSCTLKRDLKVKDAHAVAEKIEALVTTKVDKVRKVFVHTEPPSG